MFALYDKATHNVLAEYDSFQEADQRRIQIVGANPELAPALEVLDLDETFARYGQAATDAAQTQRA